MRAGRASDPTELRAPESAVSGALRGLRELLTERTGPSKCLPTQGRDRDSRARDVPGRAKGSVMFPRFKKAAAALVAVAAVAVGGAAIGSAATSGSTTTTTATTTTVTPSTHGPPASMP